jgi:two-component system sporulation sensor kinase A
MRRNPQLKTDFEHAFSYAAIGMALVDLNGRCIKANSSLCDFFGYSEQEVLDTTFQVITHPDDLDLDVDYVNQMLDGKMNTYRMEKRYYHKSGDIVWAILSVSLVRNEQGEPLYFISQIQDITDRKRMEEQIRESELRFRLLAENSLDMIGRLSPDNICLYVSPSCKQILGYDPEELVGIRVETFIHPEDLIEMRGQTFLHEPDEQVRTFRTRRKDGTYVWLESKSKMVRDENNAFKESISVLRDITEQKRYIEENDRLHHNNELILSAVAEGIFGLDMEGRATFANPAAARMTGYEVDELLGKKQHSLIHHSRSDGSIYPLEECHIHKSMDEGTTVHVANELFWRKDGSSFPVEYVSTPIQEKGEIVGAVVTFRDITTQNQAQEKILKSEMKFRSIVQSANDAIILTDVNMNIISWNNGATRIFGYTEEQTVGAGLDMIVPIRYREAHHRGVQRFLDTGKSQVVGKTVEMYGFRKDGSEFPLEFSLNTWKIGEDIFFSAIIRDITDRKRFEEDLKKSEENYRRLLEDLPEAVILAKGDQWLYVNEMAVKLLGASSKEEVLTRSVFETVHPDYHVNVEERINNVEKSRENIKATEEKFIRLDGQTIDVEVVSLPSVYEKEDIRCVIVRDVSEKKRTQQLMLHSEKLSVAGQLAAGIAHEIRNPLTAIKGFLQLMKPDIADKSRFFDVIFSEMDRIEMITNELLILAKPQSASLERKGVGAMLQQVVPFMDAQANMKNVQIQMEFEAEELVIECDANQLKQVFINFLKNAMEAMPEGGLITIKVSKIENSWIRICFIDQGYGIPQDELNRLGEPFYTTKEEGTGLGLMISKKIIDQHGGAIHISSKINEGTTVAVDLPSPSARQ